ncbi:MAG: MoaA/NifB/PqqE/SkfB family radical SAM enzyme [Candidatus Omnitrophota bacterium]|jgi:MoaA/NifB/PqqE/SkfB family radical SAM enzyme
MKSYYKRLFYILARDPLKIKSMWRLKNFRTNEWKKDFSNGAVDIKPPPIVSIRLNYGCDLRCVMCNQWGENGMYIKNPQHMPKRSVSTAEWKKFIDEVATFSPYINFNGGEPLLNQDVEELIHYASSKHLVTSLTTNGTHLKARGEGLIRAGLDYIHTSLDAPPSDGEPIIRQKADRTDSSREVLEALHDFIRLRDRLGIGLPIVQTQTVVVKENQHQLLKLANYMNDVLKPDVWSLQLCIFTTEELNDATTDMYQQFFNQSQLGWSGFIRDFEGMDYDGVQAQLDLIAAGNWKYKLRMYKPIGDKGFNIRSYFTEPHKHASDSRPKCMHPYAFAQLQPNGDAVFCCAQPDYNIGNIKTNSLEHIWSNQRSTQWRDFLQKKLFPSCKRCYALHELNHFAKE